MQVQHVRRADLGEHTTDHELATARRFSGYDGLRFCSDETDLLSELDRSRSLSSSPMKSIPAQASTELASAVSRFIITGITEVSRK